LSWELNKSLTGRFFQETGKPISREIPGIQERENPGKKPKSRPTSTSDAKIPILSQHFIVVFEIKSFAREFTRTL
jgi:hypothetical protein